MANAEHLAKLMAGGEAWDTWRRENPHVAPDLSRADLRAEYLYEVDLSGANLANSEMQDAKLKAADLRGANLYRAILTGADLRGTRLDGANLHQAKLRKSDLQGVDLRGAILTEADLREARLAEANLSGMDLRNLDLSNADLHGANLSNADLSRAILKSALLSKKTQLTGAIMRHINLAGADLLGVTLSGCELNDANFSEADLGGADLIGSKLMFSNMTQANLRFADLSHADLTNATLSEADLRETKFCGAILEKATLFDVILRKADLTEAKMGGAWLVGADLTAAIFQKADLKASNLDSAILVKTDLSYADLSGSSVYGISVWDVTLTGTIQSNLSITPSHEQAPIRVDDLEVAQFIYMLLNRQKLRKVITTIGEKAVLILGRFTERKVLLDGIAAKLRSLGYLPIIFDFERPPDRDITETVKVLAGLSLFVIADITNPMSVPLELQATAPEYMIPFVTIVEKQKNVFGMFGDLPRKYHWVLPLLEYDDFDTLLATFEEDVVSRALKKVAEIRLAKAAETVRRSAGTELS
jgi:uncharacterized protein YjbI with pentapeptide repeats